MASYFGQSTYCRRKANVSEFDRMNMKPHPCPTCSSVSRLKRSIIARGCSAIDDQVEDHNSDDIIIDSTGNTYYMHAFQLHRSIFRITRNNLIMQP